MYQYDGICSTSVKTLSSSNRPTTTDWHRTYSNFTRHPVPTVDRVKRPLPPQPIICEEITAKTVVPIRVWIVASVSCFAICAALVLATLVITKWGTDQGYTTKEVFTENSDNYHFSRTQPIIVNRDESTTIGAQSSNVDQQTTSGQQQSPIGDQTSDKSIENVPTTDYDVGLPDLETLSLFKDYIANDKSKQKVFETLHPVHDTLEHEERKIEKKDGAKLPQTIKTKDLTGVTLNEANELIKNEFQATEVSNRHLPRSIINDNKQNVIPKPMKEKSFSNSIDLPEFKPLLPSIEEIKLPETFIASIKNKDYDEYYNNDNLYDDYMQSNTMTSYLIEKVQELHDWISTDPDFEKVKNNTKVLGKKTEFGQLLKALNDSLQEGNVTIVMNKLRDIYFGDNYTSNSKGKRIILTNSTDMLSFGILTLDVMLLHNIQLMAWESQEATRIKMLKDPDVFAFNSLFIDPNKLESKLNEVQHGATAMTTKRQKLAETEEFDLGKNLFENVLEVGMSAARAAIHLGRAYKNARNFITQISTKESPNIQNQLSRNIDGNTHALNHLQTSFKNDSSLGVTSNGTVYTELDCVWLLYCRNLVVTAKLNAPFGTMARINGMALRMLSGELSADRALDTMLYEALTGWTDLKCNDMFPRCSQVNASAIVMDTILQPVKKSAKGR